MEFAIPVLRRREISDLVAGARIVPGFLNRSAYILALTEPPSRQSCELIERLEAAHPGSHGDVAPAAAAKPARTPEKARTRVPVFTDAHCFRASEHNLLHRIDRYAGPCERLAILPQL